MIKQCNMSGNYNSNTPFTKQNYPDRDLDCDLDQGIVLCKHSIWIAIWIILIQILGWFRYNNDWTMNYNVMQFVVLNNECPA